MTYGPDGAVARKCPGCNFTSWPKPDYDESPHPGFCPMCGLGMVRQQCRDCAAPLLAVSGGSFFGIGHQIARFCPACGADNQTPPEPKMRDKPKKPSNKASAALGEAIAGTFHVVLGSGKITFKPACDPVTGPAEFTADKAPAPRGSFLLLWPRAQKRLIAVRRERRAPPVVNRNTEAA